MQSRLSAEVGPRGRHAHLAGRRQHGARPARCRRRTCRETGWTTTTPAHGHAAAAAGHRRAPCPWRCEARSDRWGVRRLGPAQVGGFGDFAGFAWTWPEQRTADRRDGAHPRRSFTSRAALPHPVGLVGQHRSARVGGGTELAEIRPFRTGDRLRRIHWPVSLRTGALHVTTTYADQDAEVRLVLDAIRDLGERDVETGRRSSLDVAVEAAGAVAAHYLTTGDRVGLSVLGGAGHRRGAGRRRPPPARPGAARPGPRRAQPRHRRARSARCGPSCAAASRRVPSSCSCRPWSRPSRSPTPCGSPAAVTRSWSSTPSRPSCSAARRPTTRCARSPASTTPGWPGWCGACGCSTASARPAAAPMAGRAGHRLAGARVARHRAAPGGPPLPRPQGGEPMIRNRTWRRAMVGTVLVADVVILLVAGAASPRLPALRPRRPRRRHLVGAGPPGGWGAFTLLVRPGARRWACPAGCPPTLAALGAGRGRRVARSS